MNKEEYPEKIYITPTNEHIPGAAYLATEVKYKRGIEYTRSDLVYKMTNEAFENGLKQGVKGGYIIKHN